MLKEELLAALRRFGAFGRPTTELRQLDFPSAVQRAIDLGALPWKGETIAVDLMWLGSDSGGRAGRLEANRPRASAGAKAASKWGRCEVCTRPLVVIGRERKNGRVVPKLDGSPWDGSMFAIKRHKKCMSAP